MGGVVVRFTLRPLYYWPKSQAANVQVGLRVVLDVMEKRKASAHAVS
jgi:hypothetical protein